MIRRFATVVVALALVGAIAGCSKKDSGVTEASSDTTETTTTSTTKDTKGTSDTKGGGSGLPANLEDCAVASQFFASILGTSGSFMGGITDSQTQDLQDEIDRLQDSVPQELRDDFATVATAYEDLMTVFSGADASDYLDEGFQKKLEEASKSMDSPKVTAAMDNIETYFEENCS